MAGHKPLSESQQLIARRRVARRLAMQGAYQWLITGNSFQEIYLYFQEELGSGGRFPQMRRGVLPQTAALRD